MNAAKDLIGGIRHVNQKTSNQKNNNEQSQRSREVEEVDLSANKLDQKMMDEVTRFANPNRYSDFIYPK